MFDDWINNWFSNVLLICIFIILASVILFIVSGLIHVSVTSKHNYNGIVHKKYEDFGDDFTSNMTDLDYTLILKRKKTLYKVRNVNKAFYYSLNENDTVRFQVSYGLFRNTILQPIFNTPTRVRLAKEIKIPLRPV
jgi:hypothetical protein